jgi:large subunit ribosomal protein L19
MSGVIDSLEREQLRKVPSFDAGDRVKVHFQVVEGSRRRTQVFEGTVLKRQGAGARETFTVRKQSFGVGVERTFPVHSPKIERIEVASRGAVRRAKLYYLRGRVGRRARVRERQYTGVIEGDGAAGRAPEEPPVEEMADEQGALEGAELVAEPSEPEPEPEAPEAAEGQGASAASDAGEPSDDAGTSDQPADAPEEAEPGSDDDPAAR